MIKYLVILLLYISTLSANHNKVSIINERNNRDINVYIKNNNLYDITVLYAAKIKNLASSEELPIEKVVKARSKVNMANFFILGRKYSLSSTFKYTIGSKYVMHNDNYIYRLPYKLGTSRMVAQGFNGKFSHFGNSLYAVDFSMPIGTKIYAAREGIVVNTKSDGKNFGGKKHIKDANFITIRHIDGTYAKYVHLQRRGVKVRIGQRVRRGQFIGLSGNTGYTNGPHLHIVVFKGKRFNSRDSIPIKFMSSHGIVHIPVRGKTYTAVKLQQLKRSSYGRFNR